MYIDNNMRTDLAKFEVGDSVKKYHALAVYVELLMRAVYRDVEFDGIKLSRGQCIISIKKIAERTELSEPTISRVIAELEDNGYIRITKQKKCNVYTLLHYDWEYYSKQKAIID